MDSLTHIALGACIGEAFFEKGFGKKAMVWGLLAQSIPDIDFVAGFWMDTPETLLAHRGFTHSILFGLLITPAFALLADKIHKPHNIPFRKWLLFFALEVFVHLFIDGFNNYGVAWFEPFSHHRFSFNAIYVADPFFSFWPILAAAILAILHAHHPGRAFWWKFGVLLPALYLGYCAFNKTLIDHQVQRAFQNQHIPHKDYFTTPAPLQNWLWFVTAADTAGFHVGYRSVFDGQKPVDFEYFPRNDSLLLPIHDREDVRRLIRFSQDFYTVERWHDTLVFNDLRFGQEVGWENPRGRFAFHYYLSHPGENDLVVQRGRFAGWNRVTFLSMCNRAAGR